MPKSELLIVSYAKDIPYLQHCLRSMWKFANGFSGVTLVTPKDEAEQFHDIIKMWSVKSRTYDRVPDSLRWHLHAQTQKCLADQHCPEADFIVHMDSDCIFTEPVTPDDYFVGGKPVMVIKPFAKIPGSPWKAVVDAALKMNSVYSTMERHPQINPIGIYPRLRKWLEYLHREPFETFVLSRKPTFPWHFTEHNIIGNFALSHAKDQYRWIDASREPLPHEKVRQFWSYSPPDQKQASPHGEPDATPIEIIKKVLGDA